MFLSELGPAKGSRKNRKRIGRGPGSGYGKTAGRGHKGQKSRSGYAGKPGFEGGQMPLQRRLPKRGFTNIFSKRYQVVNLDRLAAFKAGDDINAESLHKAGIIRSANAPVKILGNGKLDKALNITADAFSAAAKESIEKAGGKAEVKQS
jgi:large subunit ribosomal protein L15